MRRIILLLLLVLPFGYLRANHWNPDPYQYPDNMNVVGVIEINGVEQATDALELGAFCGEECRGSEMLTFYGGLERYLVFLTLYGEMGDVFTFKLYNHASQQELDVESEQTIQFVANQVLGTVIEPYVFAFSGVSLSFIIDARAIPDTAGMVEGMGTYFADDLCTLRAEAFEGFSFVNWTEEGIQVSTEPTYAFIVSSDRFLEANFSVNSYEIIVGHQPEEGGIVEGGGVYDYGSTATVTATANNTYYFINWTEDEAVVSTSSIYSFLVERDRNLVATFAQSCYVVEVSADPVEGGSVEGGGNYVVGTQCQLVAHPSQGFVFVNWTENGQVVSTQQNYSFVVDDDHSFVAHFEVLYYSVLATAMPSNGGTVEGSGTYTFGQTATLIAYPNAYYVFQKWTENSGYISDNPTLSFTVTRNRYLVAHFFYYDGLEEKELKINVFPNPTDGIVNVEGVTKERLSVYNLYGQLLLVKEGNQLDLSQFPDGMYFLQFQTEKGTVIKKVLKR